MTLNSYYFIEYLSGNIHILLDDAAVTIGGRVWQIIGSKNAYVIKNEISMINISNFVYSSSYVNYKSSIFSFGGGGSSGTFVFSSFADSNFFSIDLNEICHDGICKALCSSGTF